MAPSIPIRQLAVERSFTPSSALLFGRIMTVFGVALLAGISPLMFSGSHFATTLLADLIAIAVVTAGVVVYALLALRNTRVDSAPGRLRIRNFLGASHEVNPHHLDRVVVVRAIVPAKGENRKTPGARLFVLDGTGRSVLRWADNAWTIEQMQQLATSLALPIDSIDEPISRRDLVARHPKALQFAEARPVLFVTLLVGAILAVAAVIVAIAVNAGR